MPKHNLIELLGICISHRHNLPEHESQQGIGHQAQGLPTGAEESASYIEVDDVPAAAYRLVHGCKGGAQWLYTCRRWAWQL